jgi:hypothetical protein
MLPNFKQGEIQMIKDLTFKKEYHNQASRCTAKPYIVEVQQKKIFGIMDGDYFISSCYGETKTVYICDDYDLDGNEFETEQELKDYIIDNYEHEIEYYDIREVQLGYIWFPVAIFFTVEEAEKYINGRDNLRTWIRHIDSQESEMIELMKMGGLLDD